MDDGGNQPGSGRRWRIESTFDEPCVVVPLFNASIMGSEFLVQQGLPEIENAVVKKEFRFY